MGYSHSEAFLAEVISEGSKADVAGHRRALPRLVELKQHSHGFLSTPRPLTRPHLEDDTANTPNIDFGIIARFARVDHLGGHPKDGSLHGSVRASHIDIFGAPRDTKV